MHAAPNVILISSSYRFPLLFLSIFFLSAKHFFVHVDY